MSCGQTGSIDRDVLKMSFDAAIRENRQGEIRVAETLIEDLAQELEVIRSRMMVVDRSLDQIARWHIWRGYSSEFDALELGECAPLYDVVFTCHDDSSFTLKFVRKK